MVVQVVLMAVCMVVLEALMVAVVAVVIGINLEVAQPSVEQAVLVQ
jgi:hypothetical protein